MQVSSINMANYNAPKKSLAEKNFGAKIPQKELDKFLDSLQTVLPEGRTSEVVTHLKNRMDEIRAIKIDGKEPTISFGPLIKDEQLVFPTNHYYVITAELPNNGGKGTCPICIMSDWYPFLGFASAKTIVRDMVYRIGHATNAIKKDSVYVKNQTEKLYKDWNA